MNKLKTVVMGLGVVAVFAAMKSAVAGPVTFQTDAGPTESVGSDLAIKNESFSHSYTFHLDSRQEISVSLQTQGQQKGDKFLDPQMSILDVYISRPGSKERIPLTPVAGTDFSNSQNTGLKQWVLAKKPVLADGYWTLNIEGQGGIKNGKSADSYIARLDGVSVVPEPQSLALSLLGLGALVYARRTRRA
jgi:hypothetical protein